MKLSGNTILITGGGSGIGLALAKAFSHKKGNTVIVCGRNVQKLESVQAENPEIVIFPCDIVDAQQQRHLAEFIEEKHPNLNMLINNAGIQHNYNFLENKVKTSVIEEEMNINFLAQVKLTNRLLPILMQQPSAGIVNVTSALALVPKKSAPIYCATKAAMHAFTQVIRYQLEHTAVKVFEIIPALVDTEMTKGRGKGKITPELLATEALKGIESDRYEIRIGKTKLLFALNRIMPSVAARIIKNG